VIKRRALIQGSAASISFGSLCARTAAQSTPESDRGALPIHRWELQSLSIAGEEMILSDPSRYFIQFPDQQTVYLRADCNQGSGKYAREGDSVAMSEITTTLVFCGEESLDQHFLAALQAASTISISTDKSDQLLLSSADGETRATFTPGLKAVLWQWTVSRTERGAEIRPQTPERYTVEVFEDGSALVRADCNNGRGTVTTEDGQIELRIGMTRRQCGDASNFADFARVLNEATSWKIASGSLTLTVDESGETATFEAVGTSPPEAEGTPVDN
jgi:heat shock protein HslJ